MPLKEINNFGPFSSLQIEDDAPTFESVYPNPDTKIFYQLRKYTFDKLVYIEKGIGRLIKDSVFVRESIIARGPDFDQLIVPEENKARPLSVAPDECLIIGSDVPNSYHTALSIPHSVLTSGLDSVRLTQLRPNSFLGRLDGNIEAVSFDELRENPQFCALIRNIMGRTNTGEGT